MSLRKFRPIRSAALWKAPDSFITSAAKCQFPPDIRQRSTATFNVGHRSFCVCQNASYGSMSSGPPRHHLSRRRRRSCGLRAQRRPVRNRSHEGSNDVEGQPGARHDDCSSMIVRRKEVSLDSEFIQLGNITVSWNGRAIACRGFYGAVYIQGWWIGGGRHDNLQHSQCAMLHRRPGAAASCPRHTQRAHSFDRLRICFALTGDITTFV